MIGILGQGFVGKAIYQKFKNYFDVHTFDLDTSKANVSFETVVENKIIFVYISKPMSADGSCNTSIVEREMEKLDRLGKYPIVVKPTILHRTTKAWDEKHQSDIVFNPGFLTKKNAVKDFETQKQN
jgi:UDP-glucose 6-dehydrogenase